MNNILTKKLAICSLFLSMLIIVEYFDCIIPFKQVYLLSLCGAIVWFITAKYNGFTGLYFYFAGCILMFIFLPNKQNALYFTVFFGLYSVLKYFFNKIKPIWLSYLIRLFSMNLQIFLLFLITIILFSNYSAFAFNKYHYIIFLCMIVVIQVIFIIYDFGLTYINKYFCKLGKLVNL